MGEAHRVQFEREVAALKRFSRWDPQHLVKLLATYQYEGHYHLIFPWANGNLQDFWSHRPTPEKSYDGLRWIAKQCHGLMEALNRLHNDDFSAVDAQKPKGGSRLLNVKDATGKSGRHGDIKPKNILWFEEAGGPVLKLCDFGLASFHRKVSELQEYESLLGSTSYRAPEFDVEKRVSPMYDMWAMGCVFLEFISWYVLGYKEGVDEFTNVRLRDDVEVVKQDTFFQLVTRSVGQETKFGARQKASVKEVSFRRIREDLEHGKHGGAYTGLAY
jgi:serine/threonine protein kinase